MRLIVIITQNSWLQISNTEYYGIVVD